MQDDSPYAPPKAGYVGKGHIVYEEMRPLSLTQRLNRLRYACYQLTVMVVVALVGVLAAVLVGSAGSGELKENEVLAISLGLLMGAALLAVMVYMFGLSVRRLHDIGHSGWLVLIMVLPVVVVPLAIFLGGGERLVLLATAIQPLFMLYLFAAAGTAGMNSYGTPNPPNGMLVMIFGGLWWCLWVLMLLANIAMAIFSVFAPELLSGWGMDGQQQQLEELEKLLRQF